jgi:hypothetical protein
MKNDYTVSEDGRAVTLWLNHKGGRLACHIDAADLEKLKTIKSTWYAQWNKDTRSFYAPTSVPGKPKRNVLLMHRFLTDAPKGLDIDHLNHDTLDNRRCNLRITTRSVNQMNRRGANRRSTSGHRGIFPSRAKGKFQLQLTINGKRKYIGTFSSIDEAIAHEKQKNYDCRIHHGCAQGLPY